MAKRENNFWIKWSTDTTHPLDECQVIDRRKYKGRKAVPEFTSEREERDAA